MSGGAGTTICMVPEGDQVIIAGDFNCHHPMWNPDRYIRYDEDADALIAMMAELDLNLLLPWGIVTYPNASTTIDLIWSSNKILHWLIKCHITEEYEWAFSSYNYDRTNWDELSDKLESFLLSIIPIIMSAKLKLLNSIEFEFKECFAPLLRPEFLPNSWKILTEFNQILARLKWLLFKCGSNMWIEF